MVALVRVEATVAHHLVGVYDGTQEASLPLCTSYRTLKSSPTSLQGFAGTGVQDGIPYWAAIPGMAVVGVCGYFLGKRQCRRGSLSGFRRSLRRW